jgi:hypothetical protein
MPRVKIVGGFVAVLITHTPNRQHPKPVVDGDIRRPASWTRDEFAPWTVGVLGAGGITGEMWAFTHLKDT